MTLCLRVKFFLAIPVFPPTFFFGPPLPENDSLRLPIEYFNDFISNELKCIMVD